MHEGMKICRGKKRETVTLCVFVRALGKTEKGKQNMLQHFSHLDIYFLKNSQLRC